ncbi:hypothetical protein C8F04DRAFT_1059877 [Mycena alexandri]|uniref:Secreted protein n=1 Tax=Mycena alexandri TaxID=1745969 RepID=A0AAD6TMS6_9AGAR|nr:hypothetical protein C8F04DRAFT_1059877 [Mycena alexandri]
MIPLPPPIHSVVHLHVGFVFLLQCLRCHLDVESAHWYTHKVLSRHQSVQPLLSACTSNLFGPTGSLTPRP